MLLELYRQHFLRLFVWKSCSDKSTQTKITLQDSIIVVLANFENDI